MKHKISLLFIVTGVLLIGLAAFQYFHSKQQLSAALHEAEKLVSMNVKEETAASASAKIDVPPFKENDVVGILHIPKIEGKLPIVEGTDEADLAKGVGHYRSTVFPGEQEQILLSGHRDTTFRKFGELEAGDQFIIDMPYGSYTYEMREAVIVPADDTSIIGPKGEEVLTLSTCYPFSYIGSAPDRYVIFAYPVETDIPE
ncbi:class D sortase [Ornithinibacillus gellani]|uniref:class D sortase n=1 Tax=Ornithinibacillus gellani TaxID=2293253 RepID=UPI000F498473|nr:class D sortase [Ornithinibacillus gellani]TQS71089.1 class D sortase [Ornithinibacillus gellani]